MNEIFISYSRRDKAFVERFLAALKDNGYSSDNIWVDWEDIPASSDWEAEIKKGIETANSIIFILSPEWAKSGECAKELRFATEYNKRLFPIVWQNVDPNTIQKELGSINWIFFRETDDFDAAMQKLLAALKTDLGWVAQHTTLLTRANEWNTKNRDDGYLLRGSELQESETWLSQASEDKQPQPSPLQKEYIFTSRQDDVRRQRRNLIMVSTAMVVSIALAIAAVVSGISALRQSQKALASQLAAQSIALVDTQPDLSFLLSLEANYIGDELGESDPAWTGSLLTALNSSPKLGTFLRAHESDVRALAFSPDGRWLATAGGLPTDDAKTGEVYLWDMNISPKKPQKLNAGAVDRLLGVAFSADSKTLVAAGNGKQLLVWNTDQCCDPIHRWDVTDKVRAIKFVTINGHEYLAAAIANQVTFWDISNGQEQTDLKLQIEAINDKIRVLSLAFSPTTHELAAGSEDGAVTVWNLDSREVKFHVCSYGDAEASGSTACEVVDTEIKEIRGLAFNHDAALLIAGSSDQHAWLWNAQTGEFLTKTPDPNEGGHINTVTSVAFNPKNEQQVATVSWDNTVRFWDLTQAEDNNWSFHRSDTLAGHSNSIWATAFSPDGRWLASGSSDKSVILWKVNQINQIGIPVAKMDGDVWALAVSPDQDQFAAGDAAGNIRIWNFDGKTISEALTLNHPEGVLALTYSHDGKWLASAGNDKAIRVWDVQTGKEVWHQENAHGKEIWSLAFSPDDHLLASASYDKTVKLWDTTTHTVTNTLQHTDRVFALTFNDDGSQLLVAGFESDIYLWNLTKPASIPEATRLKGHIYSVNSLTYNPKYPPLLASTSDDKTLLIWNADLKESTPPVLGLNESMEAVTFRPSGDWLASATNNSTVLLWQLDPVTCSKEWNKDACQPSRLGAPLVGHQAPVNNVVFLSDTAMISSSGDGQLIYWNLEKSFWYKHACGIVNRSFSDAEYSQYIQGKLNTILLDTVNWFSDRFGSGILEDAPSCLSSLP